MNLKKCYGVVSTRKMKRETFRGKILEELKNNTLPLNTIKELREKSETIFGKIRTILSPVNIIEFEGLLEIENITILKKKIII